MVDLFERLEDFVVEVNNYPYYSSELWNKEKGIIRVYGRDGNKRKINRVIYPKKHYTKSYIEDNILKEYDVCPLCDIGVPIVNVIKTRKHVSIKQPVTLYFLLGAVSVPFLLYIIKKKLTISES